MAAAREEEGQEARVGGGRSRGGFMEGKARGGGGCRWRPPWARTSRALLRTGKKTTRGRRWAESNVHGPLWVSFAWLPFFSFLEIPEFS